MRRIATCWCRRRWRASRRAAARRSPPRDAVVIGDTPLDVGCAAHVGARSLAVATGSHSVEELRAAGADVVLQDLSDTDAVLALRIDRVLIGSERGPVALPVFKIGRSPLTRGGWVRLPGASATIDP